jgi:hypothetical protein
MISRVPTDTVRGSRQRSKERKLLDESSGTVMNITIILAMCNLRVKGFTDSFHNENERVFLSVISLFSKCDPILQEGYRYSKIFRPFSTEFNYLNQRAHKLYIKKTVETFIEVTVIKVKI